MIDYLDIDQISDALYNIERVSDNQFVDIIIDNFHIQIFAGHTALCQPKIFLGKVTSYKNVGIRLIEIAKDMNRIICPLQDDRFKNFSWSQYYAYYNQKGNKLPSSFGSYVPIQEIARMIREVYKISKLKIFF